MSSPATDRAIQRVLLAMDSSTALDLLPAAAELAARMRAELQGLFVENSDLLRLSALPFAQEICATSAVARPLTAAGVERQMNRLADELRRSLAAIAEQAKVAWSFQVARGALDRVTRESTRDADLWLVGSRATPRSAARGKSAGHGPASSGSAAAPIPAGAIVVWFDGSPAARRALAVAGELAAARHAVVELSLPANGEVRKSLRSLAAECLSPYATLPRILPTPAHTREELLAVVRDQRCALLLLPATSPFLDDVSPPALAAQLGTLLGIVK